MSLGAYEIFEASGDLPEPVWPDYSFEEILKIAFRERIVDRPDHPLVQRLRGVVVAMAELMACRHPTDPVGGDTASPPEVAPDKMVRSYARAVHPIPRRCSHRLGARSMQALPCLQQAGAVHRRTVGHCLTFFPSREIWAVDFEFGAEPGENPEPVCLVAMGLAQRSQAAPMARRVRRRAPRTRPAPTCCSSPTTPAQKSVVISPSAGQCPERVLDLFTEFRNHTNGIPTASGAGLLGALAYYGLDSIGTVEKDEMRDLILRGGPWTDAEREAILDYCESDVEALARLLPAMLPKIDLPRALLRGRYMAAAAQMERNGVPIDTDTLELLRRHWSDIQDQLIAEVDRDYGVYEGRTFKADRFADWLTRNNIPWPSLDSGRLDLSDDTFREMARAFPIVAPLRELRSCPVPDAAFRSSGR